MSRYIHIAILPSMMLGHSDRYFPFYPSIEQIYGFLHSCHICMGLSLIVIIYIHVCTHTYVRSSISPVLSHLLVVLVLRVLSYCLYNKRWTYVLRRDGAKRSEQGGGTSKIGASNPKNSKSEKIIYCLQNRRKLFIVVLQNRRKFCTVVLQNGRKFYTVVL